MIMIILGLVIEGRLLTAIGVIKITIWTSLVKIIVVAGC